MAEAETKLSREIRATFIHGVTGQEVSDDLLPAGTAYTLEFQREDYTTDTPAIVSTIMVAEPRPGDQILYYLYRTRDLPDMREGEDR